MATCLYKDKPCSICHQMIGIGEDCIYESETKGVHHFECEDNAPPGPDASRLADELGYRQYTWDEIRNGISEDRS